MIGLTANSSSGYNQTHDFGHLANSADNDYVSAAVETGKMSNIRQYEGTQTTETLNRDIKSQLQNSSK